MSIVYKMSENPTELFLKALNENDCCSLLDLATQYKSKQTSVNLEELFSTLKQSELDEVGKKLLKLLEDHCVNSSNLTVDNNAHYDEEIVNVLKAVVPIVHFTFQYSSCIPASVIQIATLLDDILLNIHENEDSLKNAICQLCENLWNKDLLEKGIGKNTIIYLLQRTLRHKGTKADVKRVWALRKSLLLLINNETAANCSDILKLLEKCVMSSLYLSFLEGQKFISFLFELDVSLIEILHKAVRSQLLECSLKESETYGVIYFKAWNNAPDQIKEQLETCCIQDFMFHAIHVARNIPHSLAPVLRKLLSSFHKQKKNRCVSKMLTRLYEPILWRSLKVANGYVRANAATLFFDAFPLEDPDSNIEETDATLTKQFEIIKDLLDDECPLVRSISAVGVCMVLNYQWELVPLPMIKVFIKRLVDLSHDSSSSDVRASVIKGLTTLMDNPLAHPTLKAILPAFQDSFHDISEKVRLAFCNLLLKVKGIRSIKYWNIVPVEHLLARMEEDRSSVARRIVELIHNSYLPISKPEHEWLERCINLIESDRGASRVFFQHVHRFIGIDITVNFMLMICKTLYIYAKARLESESLTAYSDLIASISEESENKENISNNVTLSDCSQNTEREFLFDNPEVVLGVLEATSILWIGIRSSLQLPANKKHYKLLVAKFSKAMPVLLKFFKSSQAWDSLLYLSSFLPSNCLPSLGNLCLSHLKSFPETSTEAEYVTILESICNHGRALDLLELIEQWMEYGLNKGSQNSPQRKVYKRKQKKVTIVEHHSPKPLLAVHFLETLLKQPVCQDIVLKTQTSVLRRILNQIQVAKIAIERLKITQEFEQLMSFLPEAFSSYIKIAVLLHSKEQLENCNSYEIFEDLFIWTTSQLLTIKKGNGGEMVEENAKAKKNVRNFQQDTWNKLSFPICNILLTASSDMILIGIANEQFCSLSATFSIQVLKSEFGYMFIHLAARLMYQISEYATILFRLQSSENHIEMLVPKILSNIIQVLACKNFEEKAIESETAAFKNILNELLLSLYHLPPENEIILQEIFSTIMAAIIVENVHQLEKCQEIESYASIKNLPFVTTTLMTVLCVRQEFMQMFLAQMNECLKSGAMKNILEILASVTLLNTICQNKSFCKLTNENLKEIVATAEVALHAFAPSKDKYNDLNITEATLFASDFERTYYRLSRKQLRDAITSVN